MNGYITYWSKEYVGELAKNNDTGPMCVVYGSRHVRMPYISSLKIGDIVYPVTIQNKKFYIMSRLPIEKIEPAFDYLIRETGKPHSCLLPEGVFIKSPEKLSNIGEFFPKDSKTGYPAEIFENGLIFIDENGLTDIPHKFHQEPVTCCADISASGVHGSEIFPREVPRELLQKMCFGKTPKTQKPLHFDKDGFPTSISLSGFIRKMSDETIKIFENFFDFD